jgi:hypothetical protein
MARKTPTKKQIKQRMRGKSYQRLVALVVSAMDPTSVVEEGRWVEGPDGTRDMDVLITGTVEGKKRRILVECKDYDPQTTGKVGIEVIDALESKRHDLAVDMALVCSNSGYTTTALRKAKRTGIGLISILIAEDPEIKVKIEEVVYFRHIKVIDTTVDFGVLVPKDTEPYKILFKGLPFLYWLHGRIMALLPYKAKISGTFSITQKFETPVELDFGGTHIKFSNLKFMVTQETTWFSQVVELDASMGIYDYIRGKVRLIPGEAKYVMKGFNIDNGTPIDFIPDLPDLHSNLLPGEINLTLSSVTGLVIPKDPMQIPRISDLLLPDELGSMQHELTKN